jgi:hypothetical protein
VRTLVKKRIPKVKFYEPRKNLPGKTSALENAESRFAIRFAHTYLNHFDSLHRKTTKTSIACAREIQINGFGIADFVAIAWNAARLEEKSSKYDSKFFITSVKPTMRAFEFKLSNWRKALMQASRYKFFANVSIVVLPIEKCGPPLKYLNTFKQVHVGLWGFDKNTNRIVTYYTPKPNKPIDSKYQILALELVASASKSLPIS